MHLLAAGDVSQSLTLLIPATCSGIAAVVGAWALLIRAKGDTAKPLTVLRRVWDWVQASGLESEMPERLREDVLGELRDDEAKR